jgi:alkaline phosphatase
MTRRIAACLLVLAAAAPALAQDEEPRRSVIYFIGDGMGTSQVTLGRLAARELGQPYALDRFQVVGQAMTRSASNLVTDSAAGATALACGAKTDNKVVGLDPQGRPLQTLVEAAHEAGYTTGLVTTTRITHATPACFAAHVKHRKEEGAIADQLVARGFPEVLIGGGARHFGEARRAKLAGHGYAIVDDPAALAAAQPGVKGRRRLAGLIAKSHVPYKVDGGARVSLKAMAQKAVEVLAPDGPFVLMVEGGRVDHACHAHDAIGTVHEQLELAEAVGWALDRAAKDPNLLVVVTADHATGNLGISERVNVKALLEAKASTEALARGAKDLASPAGREAFTKAVLDAYGFKLSAEQLDHIGSKAGNKYWAGTALGNIASEHYGMYYFGAEEQEKRLTHTHGHDGANVPVYAFGPGAERFAGTYENIEIPRRIVAILGLEQSVEQGSPLLGAADAPRKAPSYFK